MSEFILIKRKIIFFTIALGLGLLGLIYNKITERSNKQTTLNAEDSTLISPSSDNSSNPTIDSKQTEKTVIHQLKTTNGLAWVMCSDCNGKGIMRVREKCNNCDGKKKLACPTCNDNGKFKCPSCIGFGKVMCKKCGGKGCLFCGTGYLSCKVCKGLGLLFCSNCNGKGQMACIKCAGSGELYGKAACTSCFGKGKRQIAIQN